MASMMIGASPGPTPSRRRSSKKSRRISASGASLTGSTSSSDTCEGVPECQPGAVEAGGDCGGCSVDQRVCGDDCTWGPWACVADEGACAVWILRDGAREWEGAWRAGERHGTWTLYDAAGAVLEVEVWDAGTRVAHSDLPGGGQAPDGRR